MTVSHRLVFTRTLFTALAVSAATPCSSFAGPGWGTSSIAEREIARRYARQEDARQALERGDKAYAEGDYETALSEYKAAIDALPNAPMTQEWRDLASAKYADCSVALARDRAKNGRYPEANDLLKGALAINPNHKGARTLLLQLDDPDRFPRALTPEHVTKVQEVERGLEKSNSFKELGDLDKSLLEYQDVVRKDPYNKAARRGMERVEQLRSEYFDTARDHTRAAMLAKVDEEWETKVPVAGLDIKSIEGISTQPSAYIKDKMERIRFPQVSFTGATVEEAIEFLRVKSKDLDTMEKNPEQKGVNIIMKTGDTPVSAQITLDLRDVPMAEALRYITELAGMKFKIEPYAVLVVPLSETTTEQYTRIYRVPPDFLSLGGGEAGAGGGADAPKADPFAAGKADAGGSGLIKRKTALEIMKGQGIDFPVGSSAVFNPVTSQLIVKNTQPNLDLVEAFVQSIIDQKPKMIYITSKFVEVSQKNTDELGFDWLLGPFNIPSSNRVFASGGTAGNSTNGATSADYPFTSSGTTAIGTNPITSGNRSGTSAVTSDSIDGLISGQNLTSSLAPGILAFSGVFTDPQFQVVIRALSQKKGVDLMSAPSVTSKSGQEALVEVVREFIYPTEFDPPQIPQTVGASQGTTSLLGTSTGTSGSFPVTPTTPTAFEMRPVGVRMTVLPTVGGDGYTIDLELAPEVTEFEGFINYGSPINTSGSDALGNPTTVVLTENKIEQPVFSSRKLKTSVTVFDGATVALGGLIREDVQDVEDKVPLLGDIPILGRLFQSKAEDHFKRNLMIFVTASLIDPSGTKIRLPSPAITSPDTAGAGPNPLLPPAGQ